MLAVLWPLGKLCDSERSSGSFVGLRHTCEQPYALSHGFALEAFRLWICGRKKP